MNIIHRLYKDFTLAIYGSVVASRQPHFVKMQCNFYTLDENWYEGELKIISRYIHKYGDKGSKGIDS